MAEGEGPKIQIDSDWKAQAQAEKQRLAEQSKAKAASAGAAQGAGGAAGTGGAGQAGREASPEAGGMPPATFETLMSTMATQALFAMGAIPDPRTGERIAHLDLARHHIDMLTVLEEKTKGNLSEEEASTLSATVYELRNRYVQLAASARASAAGGSGGAGGGFGGGMEGGLGLGGA